MDYENRRFIFVADVFVKDFVGGAELTFDALINGMPAGDFSLSNNGGCITGTKTSELTDSYIEQNKDHIFIFGNCTSITKRQIQNLLHHKVQYYKVEMDFMYCVYRSSHLHKIQTGKECDCNRNLDRKHIYAFFKFAQKVFFMSENQMNEYKRLYPQMKDWNNLIVQFSTFGFFDLLLLDELRKNRTTHNNKAIVLKSNSWLKAEKETVQYCVDNNIEYDLVGNMSPTDFLKKMSEYKTLIFLPKAYDTCPRLVLEAKYLGLEVVMNENVLIKDDAVMKMNHNEFVDFLNNRREYFWSNVK